MIVPLFLNEMGAEILIILLLVQLEGKALQ